MTKRKNFAGVGIINVDCLYQDEVDKLRVDNHDECTQAELDAGTNDFDECDARFYSSGSIRASDAYVDPERPETRFRNRTRRVWDFCVETPVVWIWNRYSKYIRPRKPKS